MANRQTLRPYLCWVNFLIWIPNGIGKLKDNWSAIGIVIDGSCIEDLLHVPQTM